MTLRLRILLWVFCIFMVTMSSIFFISHIEIKSVLQKEESNLIGEVKKVDETNFKNIMSFLSINLNNRAEKMYHCFETIRTSAQWRGRFIPDEYNIKTNSWGASAAALSTFAWLDLITVDYNNKLASYIHQSAPFLRKYIKIQIDEKITIFSTKQDDGCLCAYIGVPFWSNQEIKKYVDDDKFPAFFLTQQPDQWLLYEPEQLLNLDVNTLIRRNKRINKHLFDEAITIHSDEEFNFLIKALKTMIKVTQNDLKKYPELLKTLNNPETRHSYMEKKIKEKKPDLLHHRNWCVGPLCNFSKQRPQPRWATRRDFEHKMGQKNLIWELCTLTRTGIWDFTPFDEKAPKGIVTALDPTVPANYDYLKNIAEGVFISDIFLNKSANIQKTCELKTKNPEYVRQIIFKNDPTGVAQSCKNQKLKILYNPPLKEPFITSTKFLSYIKPPMVKPNNASITLGVSLDPMLINLALVSPDDVAFIFGDNNIRLYTTDGAVVNIDNDNDWNREQLLSQKQGSLIDSEGNKIFFKHIAKITENDGHIVLIETQESRTNIIQAINKQIEYLFKYQTIRFALLVIISLSLMMVVLNWIINSITTPIKELAEATDHLTDRSIDKIKLNEKQIQKNDEIAILYRSFNSMINSMKEGVKVRGLLDKVVSKQVAEKIVKEGIKLGGEKRNLSILFCDIRNFTSITEKMDPEDVLIMLNECLTLLSAVIDDFEGVIDKYEGDKIMTLFGAPLETKNHSLQAVLCAIEMQNVISVWNENRERSGLCKLEIGIGIHTGEAVAGNVGAENHLSYTVLGHMVNLSARICDFAKGKEILITKDTLNNIADHIEYEEKPAEQFKGISEPVITFKVIRKK